MKFNFSSSQIIAFCDRYLKGIFICFLLSLVIASYAIFVSPIDYQQGNAVKIMYIHVPSAWLALLIYSMIAICSVMSFIYASPLSSLIAISLAPIGAIFAFIALVTGSIWGKPIWGIWWVWDARLTSMLILFFIYLAYIALYGAFDSFLVGSKVAAWLAIFGFINIPIIKFSVNIWHSLHQPASILRKSGISIDAAMLKPLALSFIVSLIYTILVFLMRLKSFLIQRKLIRITKQI